jgi:hypothetical protein
LAKKIQWTNPHIWIWIDVTDDEGNVVTWGIEGMSPNDLARPGQAWPGEDGRGRRSASATRSPP